MAQKIFFKKFIDDLKRKMESGETPKVALSEIMSLSNFEKYYKLDKEGKIVYNKNRPVHILEDITSSSSLRKVYDAYLEFYDKDGQEYDLHKTLWIAKIAYQEKRNQGGLPPGFAKFIEEVDKALNNKDLFKKFLEMLVAYHKYFNPSAR